MKMTARNDVYISEYVLLELQKNYFRDHGILPSPQQLNSFASTIGMHAIKSKSVQLDIAWLTNDVYDLQILQDALDIHADFLITKNIKDFAVQDIYDTLHIQVVDSIPDILLRELVQVT